MKVTRVAYSSRLNAGKYVQLAEQTRRLGVVRSLVWDRYGSITGVGLSDRQIRDRWMADGTAASFGVLANAWKETVRDAVADIRAHREAAKVAVRRWINRNIPAQAERKHLYTLLKADRWTGEPRLRRLMRQHWRRGRNHTANQLIIRADNVRAFTLTEGGTVWLAVPGLLPRTSVAVPLNTTQIPSGTVRLILRGGRVEVHYQIDDQALKSSRRPVGDRTIGVDKGYSEVLTDSDGVHHGPELGELLRRRSDQLKARNAARAKLRSIANQAAQRGDHGKAARIRQHNLGTVRMHRREVLWKCQVRDVTYRAVHAVADKAATIIAEDLTRPFTGSTKLGRNTNRRLAAWTKGVTAQALRDVSGRRGSAVRLVNAAYTSQVIPGTDSFGRRVGDRLHCAHHGRVVWDADYAAAVTILDRAADPDIGLRTPHMRVKQIIQERGRHRSRLPDQDSSTTGDCRCGERMIQTDGQHDHWKGSRTVATLNEALDKVLGRKTADALASSLDLHTVGDLLRHYPRRYGERGELTDVAGLALGEHATVIAQVERVSKRTMRNRRGTILEVRITDGHRPLTCTFFNQAWRERELLPGRRGLFAGKVNAFRGNLQLANPEYELLDENSDESIVEEFAKALIPVYPAAAGMQSWQIGRCVRQVLDVWDGTEDPLPESLRREHRLAGLEESLRRIHKPADRGDVARAQHRLKWDEALAVQLVLAQRRLSVGDRPAPACPPVTGGLLDAFDAKLPFTLTQGQQEVGADVTRELSGVHPMNRLLQGEVGSGKTVVALRAMLQVVDAGRQAAMLAPTEVLAAQHARSLAELLGDLAMGGELGGAERATRITLLTGSLNTAQRRAALLDAASGAAGIVVGTHALIQDKVSFADLGFVVVDEQHRFGVEQRDALRTRAGDGTSPHVLVMTATPIPRTVAMTVYGDLETSSLRELPAGRSPISTTVVPVAEKPGWLDRAWERITEEVKAGHQAYVVCPRIGEAAAAGEDVDVPPTDKDGDPRAPLAVLDVAPALAEGPLAGLRVGILHGRLPSDEKDTVMRAFAAGEIDVLVATTVVEVGVNVPNATVMAIMDADRFGVSQLHQLRGRVGRGSAPGLCLLVTETPAETTTRARLDAVAQTLDGFELAQLDLELRREGDILGAAQSGQSSLRMLSLLRDVEVIEQARTVARALVDADPTLAAHPGLAGMVSELVDEQGAEYLEKS